MTDPANAFKRLSPAEGLRALDIDFEGPKHQPPLFAVVPSHCWLPVDGDPAGGVQGLAR